MKAYTRLTEALLLMIYFLALFFGSTLARIFPENWVRY